MPPMKPERWAINPAMIGQEWKWAWRDLVFLSAMGGGDWGVDGWAPLERGSAVRDWYSPVGLAIDGTAQNTNRITGHQVVHGSTLNVPPPMTFAALVSNVPAYTASGDSQYWPIISTGGLFWTGGFTPWEWVIYNRRTTEFNGHKISLYNRLSDTLYGVTGEVLAEGEGLGDAPRLIGSAWDADNTGWIRVDGLKNASPSVTGTWQSGATNARVRSFKAIVAQLSEYDFPGTIHVIYAWNRILTDGEWNQLLADPFGPIRPRLWGPELIQVGATASLLATGDGTITDLVNEADTAVNLWQSIDDDPASPNDADWINNTDENGNGFVDLTDLPADFGTADSAEITVRYRGQEYGAGNIKLHVQLFRADETTPLSDEVEATLVTGDSAFANATVAFTGLDTAATKSVWDNAKLRCRWEAV